MLLRQMKYFVTVVDCNSFTKAALKCYISQSAISQQIQALEEELGVQLIKRENKKFFLTSIGKYFYEHSSLLLNEVENLKKEIVKRAHIGITHLKIGYLKYYGVEELNLAIAEFSKVYPEISLELINGNHEELYELLHRNEVDLILTNQRRAFSDEYFEFLLSTINCFIEISTQNELSFLKYVTISKLKRLFCIIVSSKAQQKNEQDFYQSTFGFNGNFLFVETLEEGRLLVAGNKGFIPIEGKLSDIKYLPKTLKRIPIYRNNEQIKRNYCAFWRKEKEQDYIEKFVNILYKIFKRNKE